MALNLKYDIKANMGNIKKVLGKTNYYVGVAKICPRCDKPILGYSAMSRIDNKTEICSNCGNIEALEAFIKCQNDFKYKGHK